MNNPEIEVYSVKEVAGILKTICQQVWKMIPAEELSAVKVGRQWRVTAAALQDFLSDGELPI